MASYDAIILPGTDHFLMLAQPAEFNPALAQAIRMITRPEPISSDQTPASSEGD